MKHRWMTEEMKRKIDLAFLGISLKSGKDGKVDVEILDSFKAGKPKNFH